MSLHVGNKKTFGRKEKSNSMRRNECFHSLMLILWSILIKSCPISNLISYIQTSRKWSSIHHNSKEYSIRKL